MPKTIIDYSSTIIYKITCKDTNVSDVYVGHTTNFIQRKHAHKQGCNNEKLSNYKCKLYDVIRNNGGWDNWNMEIINFFNCKDHFEARQKEQEYFVSLNATLNSIEPMPKQKCKPIKVIENKSKQPLHCEKCNIVFDNIQLLEIHNNTKEHIKLQYCIECDFKCFKKSGYDKHLLSLKHKNRTNIKPLFVCKHCNKEYKARNSLWYHEQKCQSSNINNEDLNNEITPEITISVLEQNNTLIEQNNTLIEQNKLLIEQNKIIIELYKTKS
jgi:hypothetical protein